MIDFNPNVALFNEAGEMVAWCLKLDFGSLGLLQVDENHRRKGYGEIVAKAITKKIASECNEDITSNILPTNFKSLNLFEKLGYENVDKTFWIGVKKP